MVGHKDFIVSAKEELDNISNKIEQASNKKTLADLYFLISKNLAEVKARKDKIKQATLKKDIEEVETKFKNEQNNILQKIQKNYILEVNPRLKEFFSNRVVIVKNCNDWVTNLVKIHEAKINTNLTEKVFAIIASDDEFDKIPKNSIGTRAFITPEVLMQWYIEETISWQMAKYFSSDEAIHGTEYSFSDLDRIFQKTTPSHWNTEQCKFFSISEESIQQKAFEMNTKLPEELDSKQYSNFEKLRKYYEKNSKTAPESVVDDMISAFMQESKILEEEEIMLSQHLVRFKLGNIDIPTVFDFAIFNADAPITILFAIENKTESNALSNGQLIGELLALRSVKCEWLMHCQGLKVMFYRLLPSKENILDGKRKSLIIEKYSKITGKNMNESIDLSLYHIPIVIAECIRKNSK